MKKGDKLIHKHLKDCSVVLLEPTNKGWKVEQTEIIGKKTKIKKAFYDKQDLEGERSLFEKINESKYEKGGSVSGDWCYSIGGL